LFKELCEKLVLLEIIIWQTPMHMCVLAIEWSAVVYASTIAANALQCYLNCFLFLFESELKMFELGKISLLS